MEVSSEKYKALAVELPRHAAWAAAHSMTGDFCCWLHTEPASDVQPSEATHILVPELPESIIRTYKSCAAGCLVPVAGGSSRELAVAHSHTARNTNSPRSTAVLIGAQGLACTAGISGTQLEALAGYNGCHMGQL